MDEDGARELSDLRRTHSGRNGLALCQDALPGLDLKSHISTLSEPVIRSYHISMIFNLADNLEEDALIEADPELANNLRNLVQYDVGLFSDITEFVGEGATFNVRRTLFPDSRDVAFKTRVFDAERDQKKSLMEKLEAVLLELRILTHPPLRKHQNIVQLLLVAWQGDAIDRNLKWPILIVDYADRGTLVDFFENEQEVDFQTKLDIVSDIVAGLGVLHSCLIVHGDLKLLNVLIFSKKGGGVTAKLSDFGGALLDTPDSFIEPTGTPPWTAPEYNSVRPRQQLLLSDVYALGLLFWRVVLDGANPFTDGEIFEQSANQETSLAAISRIKMEDKLSELAKQSIQKHQQKFTPELRDEILDATLRLAPDERSLHQVNQAVKKHCRTTRDATTGQYERTESPEVKTDEFSEGSQEPELKLSLGGLNFENVTRVLSDPVLGAFEQTAQYDNDPERRTIAASMLARIYLGSDNFGVEQNTDKGLQYLLQAAENGSLEDAALVLRLHKACSREVPERCKTSLAQWLLEAGAMGSMTAFEDMERFGFSEELSDARAQLMTRYCGYGEEMFEFEEETLAELADPFGAEGIAYVQSEIKLGESNSQDLRGYLVRLASAWGCSGAVRYLIQDLGSDVNEANEYGHRPLLLAARSGHTQALITLIELGADPSLGDDGNDTPLHWLSAFKDEEIDVVVDRLLQHGADINHQASSFPPDGDLQFAETEHVAGTPLHRAVCRNSQRAVRKLLKAGADPNLPVQGDPDRTPTALAALLHYPEILQICLDYKGGQDEAGKQRLLTPTGRSLLIMAMEGGSLYKIQIGRLIRHGDQWESQAKKTLSVLFGAGAGSHLGDLPGEPGCPALFYAARSQPHILEFLVEHGAGGDLDKASQRYSNDDYYDLDEMVKQRPLFEAILFNKSHNALKLLDLGANPRAGENDVLPLSALYKCASASLQDLHVAEALCQRALGVDDGPPGHETPFCCAVRGGCYVLADYLRSKGADVNALSSHGLLWTSTRPRTLLGLLVLNNRPSSIAGLHFLLDDTTPSKVDLVVDPVLNQTVFHYLASLDGDSHDASTTNRSLQQCDTYFDPDSEALAMQTLPHDDDNDGSVEARGGNTALHLAVIKANFEVVAFLLAKSATASIRNNTGMTPLDIAALSYPDFEHRFVPRPVPLSLQRQLKIGRARRDGIWQLLVRATPEGVDEGVVGRFRL